MYDIKWETVVPSNDEILRLRHRIEELQKADGADGSSYYDISINGNIVSCNDVIDALGLNFNRGEAFKALWRAGRKPGTSEKYDLDKVAYFANREAARHG